MRKSIFLILVLALIAAFSALFFTGCGNKPSGGGDSGIERPEDDNKGEDTGKDKENDGNDTGDSDKNDEKPEDNDDNGGDKKPEESEKPDYQDPYEDGGWTDWQKP